MALTKDDIRVLAAAVRQLPPGVPVADRLIWNTAELAEMLNVSEATIRKSIVDNDDNPVKAGDAQEGNAWVVHQGARIPVRRDEATNAWLRFWAHEVRAAIEAATGLPLPG